ncbi:hypothetical protein ACFLVF_00665, partial [Chloroflexota bacterium]
MVTNPKDQLSLPIPITSTEYKPEYQITQKTEIALKGIERDQWAFDKLIIDPKYEGWLRRRAYIRSGHHTLHIEGNILTENEVAEVLDNPSVGIDDNQNNEEVRNWNRAMQFVDSISVNPVIPINSLLIRTAHSLILGPNDRINFPGDYRRGEAKVRHPISRKPVYTGPAAGD